VQLILAWPVRMLIVGILIFSIAIDGAGYVYRFVNKCPAQGACPGLPPNYFGWNLYIHKGLDLSGGTHIDYQLVGFPAGQSRADVQQRTINVIQKRVNALGVSEPEIRGAGSNSDRITVDLAGVNADQAEKAIGRITKLVYTKWVKDPKQDATNPAGPLHPGYKPELVKLTGDDIQTASASLDQNGVNWVVNITFDARGSDVFSNLTAANMAACPGDPTTNPQASCPERFLSTWMDLTQNDIDHWDDPGYAAQLIRPWDSPPNPTDPQPKLLIDAITLQQISGGQAQISGNFNQQSATDLATGINSGALPVSLQVLDVTQVGSTLGAQSVKLSLAAGLLGLAIVVIFMIVYYRVPGLLASLALLFYAAGVLALFKAIPVTLTLAGITGFILSVGMAVDANVLIFERFKEEVRAGRTIPAAVDAAVRRAWPAIRDSNTSTLLTCAILLFVGPAQIKGFAIVLAIGVLSSLFSSIFVTHNLLAIVLSWASARRPGLLGVDRARAV